MSLNTLYEDVEFNIKAEMGGQNLGERAFVLSEEEGLLFIWDVCL